VLRVRRGDINSQHGPQLLAGSYGAGFVSDTLQSVQLSVGTSFAPSQAQAALLAGLLLDGMRWMSFGSPAVWDWSVKGRDMGTSMRKLPFNTSQFVALAQLSGRADELASFAAAIDGQRANVATAQTGHRAYWTSDYAVMHGVSDTGVAWMSSVHMHSARTVSARCVNGQGANNEHTGMI
jgi:hypothetical protein